MFNTEQEKKSFLYTSASFVLLFLLFFLLKFSNQPTLEELEGGGGGGDIAVNFGNSDFGSGDNFQSREVVQTAARPVKPQPSVEKEIIVSENNDAPAITEVKKPSVVPKKEEPIKPIVKQAPKPSKSTQNALDDLLNGSDKSGDGNDNVGGNKGKANGDTNATGYDGGGGSGTGSGGGNGSGQGIGEGSGYGSGSGSGTGSGTGWKLSGRKLSSRGKIVPTCNEYGTVVVQIKVNRNGDVIGTKYHKGTTNTDPCLIEPAYATARSYKWQPEPKAALTQIGYITVIFKLGE